MLVYSYSTLYVERYFTLKALRHRSHSVTGNYSTACLYLVSVHQMAPPQTEVADIAAYSSFSGERLSWPGWRTYSGRFMLISGHRSAAGRA